MRQIAALVAGLVFATACGPTTRALPVSGLAPDPEPADMIGAVPYSPPADPIEMPPGMYVPDEPADSTMDFPGGGAMLRPDVELYMMEFSATCDARTAYQFEALGRRDNDWSEALEAERRRVSMLELTVEDMEPLLPSWVWGVVAGAAGGAVGLYLGLQLGAGL